ncbi:MAG: rhodanese-like domain-containing protein, partial [Verrucomicrobiota bacterium]
LALTPAMTFAETEIKNVSAEEAAKLLADKNLQLQVLDIRTQEEFEEGHIDGAILVDFRGADFKDQLKKLDKSKPYLMHCRSGGRSTTAFKTFRELEFQKIFHLNSGILGWLDAGKPVEKP